jgi:hypothetical protein
VVALSHGINLASKSNRNHKYWGSGEQISPGLPGIFYLWNEHSISGQVVKKTLICSRKIFLIIELEKSNASSPVLCYREMTEPFYLEEFNRIKHQERRKNQ